MPLPSEPIFERVASWASAHATWLSWAGLLSLLMLLATPLLLPLWVASLPRDYFVAPRQRPQGTLDWLKHAAAWALGGALIVAGVLMLFLPGQGLLTLFAGLSLVHFPGKRRLIRRVLQKRQVAEGLQWMRKRAGRPPLELPVSRRRAS